jgi:hypothetical protein
MANEDVSGNVGSMPDTTERGLIDPEAHLPRGVLKTARGYIDYEREVPAFSQELYFASAAAAGGRGRAASSTWGSNWDVEVRLMVAGPLVTALEKDCTVFFWLKC